MPPNDEPVSENFQVHFCDEARNSQGGRICAVTTQRCCAAHNSFKAMQMICSEWQWGGGGGGVIAGRTELLRR